jgi:uncharacterized protein DUF6600
MTNAAFLLTVPGRRGETEQPERPGAVPPRASAGLFHRGRPARKMQPPAAMKTFAALSVFTLAPALLAPASARAQQINTGQVSAAQPADPADPADEEQVDPAPQQEIPLADPNDTAADPSQIDWPQDVASEEAAVDSYDDGYDPQAYTQFQDELAPYGNWIDDSSYGRVWMPASSIVGDDFTPYYTGGHWVLTEYGWTWVSDWSWGWAPFHYGRWVIVSGFGWCWVPGTMWGPAWVTWRVGGGYVGWAALPPRGVSVTATYGHRTPWRFCRSGDLGLPRPRCLPLHQMRGIFHRTTLCTNDRVLTRGRTTVHINAGPRYIPRATPTKMMTVAPHAFPKRAILPRPGATISTRPWIRAANASPRPDVIGSGPTAGRHSFVPGSGMPGSGMRGHAVPGSGAPTPRIYNPPRPFAAQPHTWGPSMHAAQPPLGNIAPRINNPPPGPRVFPQPPGNRPSRPFDTNNPARVYNPPPRTPFHPPTINPTRAFAPPTVQRPPMQPFHQAYTPPQMHATPQRSFSPPQRSFSPPQHTFSPPQRSFSAPQRSFSPPQMQMAPQRSFSPPAAGQFGRSGGGMHFGGAHRR